ncbi:MAG: hypothetical protein U1E81_16095 [Xanthobacteraceae bacterium]
MARPKSAATRLDEALEASEAGKRKLAELHAARNKALLADNDVEALKLAADIDLRAQAVRGITDKIELLKAEAEKEAAERRARERAALIARIEAKLKQRDEVGAELGETIAKADALFRRLFDIAKEVRSAWPWQHYEIPPILLGEPAIVRAVECELYRVGARPALGGGVDRQRPPSFPGGKSPAIELALQPGAIRPLVDVLREASQHAGEIMKTGRASGVVPVAMVPIPPQAGGKPRERTDAEARLAALLKKQIELAEDVSPHGDELYAANLAEIVKVQSEIDEFRSLAAKGGQS